MKDEFIFLVKVILSVVAPILFFCELFSWVFTVLNQSPFHPYEYTLPHTLSVILLLGIIVNRIVQYSRDKDIFVEKKENSQVKTRLILFFRILLIPIILYALYFQILRVLSPFATSFFEVSIILLFTLMLVYQIIGIVATFSKWKK